MLGERTRPSPDCDERLIESVGRHDEAAIAALYDRWGPRLYALALHMCGDSLTAQEVVQDVFVTVWRVASRYDPSRGHPGAWLLGITRNRAIDALRSRGRRPVLVSLDGIASSGIEPLSAQPDVTQVVEERDLARMASVALQELPEKYRLPLQLAYYRGLSQREIAEHLGIPLGTVKTRMRVALDRLRSHVLLRSEPAAMARAMAEEDSAP